jgi:molybdopterin-binding protein
MVHLSRTYPMRPDFMVKGDIGGDNILTSPITVDAVKDRGLKAGDEASALTKAS